MPFAILLLYRLPFWRFTNHYFASSLFYHFHFAVSLSSFAIYHLPFYHALWALTVFYQFTISPLTITPAYNSARVFLPRSYRPLSFHFLFSAAARWPCCRLPFCHFTIAHFAAYHSFYYQFAILPFPFLPPLAPCCRLSFTILPPASSPLHHLPYYHALRAANHFYHFLPFTIYAFIIMPIYNSTRVFCRRLTSRYYIISYIPPDAPRCPRCRLPFCYFTISRFPFYFLLPCQFAI